MTSKSKAQNNRKQDAPVHASDNKQELIKKSLH